MTHFDYYAPDMLLPHIEAAIQSKNDSNVLSPVQLLIALSASCLDDLPTSINTLIDHHYGADRKLTFSDTGVLEDTLMAVQLMRYNEIKNTELGAYFDFCIKQQLPVLDVRIPTKERQANGIQFEYMTTKYTSPGQHIDSYRSAWIGIQKLTYNRVTASRKERNA